MMKPYQGHRPHTGIGEIDMTKKATTTEKKAVKRVTKEERIEAMASKIAMTADASIKAKALARSIRTWTLSSLYDNFVAIRKTAGDTAKTRGVDVPAVSTTYTYDCSTEKEKAVTFALKYSKTLDTLVVNRNTATFPLAVDENGKLTLGKNQLATSGKKAWTKDSVDYMTVDARNLEKYIRATGILEAKLENLEAKVKGKFASSIVTLYAFVNGGDNLDRFKGYDKAEEAKALEEAKRAMAKAMIEEKDRKAREEAKRLAAD